MLPEAPAEMVDELSRRYIQLYELITGEDFQFPESTKNAADRIHDVLQQELETDYACLLTNTLLRRYPLQHLASYLALSRMMPSYCFLNHSMASSRVTL